MKISKNELIEMNKTLSIKQISEKLGVHRDTVRRWFRMFKIKSKFGKGESPRGNGYEIAMFAKRNSDKEAMKKYGKTKQQMYRILWKFDNFLYSEQN